MKGRPALICVGCHRPPSALAEYIDQAEYENRAAAEDGIEDWQPMTADQWCWDNEGTLNRRNGHYLCTACYVAAGEPSAPGGWVAP